MPEDRNALIQWFQALDVYDDRGTRSRFCFDTSHQLSCSAKEGEPFGIRLDPDLDEAWASHLEELERQGAGPSTHEVMMIVETAQSALQKWRTPFGPQIEPILRKHGCKPDTLREWAEGLGMKPTFTITGRMGKRLLLDGIDGIVAGPQRDPWQHAENYEGLQTRDLAALKEILLAIASWLADGGHRQAISQALCEHRAYWEGEQRFGRTGEGQALAKAAEDARKALEKAQGRFAEQHREQVQGG